MARQLEAPEDQTSHGIHQIRERVARVTGGKESDPRSVLLAIKDDIDAGVLEGKNWGDIRQTYFVPLNRIEDKALVYRILGQNTLMKYFTALSGPGKPYQFILSLKEKDLPAYMEYEFSGAPAFLISDLMKKPLSEASLNIMISHCIHVPMFTLSLHEEHSEEQMQSFLEAVVKKHPSSKDILSRIFDANRVKYIKLMSDNINNNDGFAQASYNFRQYETALFGKTSSSY